ncbi:MAG TPA: DUF6265 family protein [Usitatibacter sp.]|nr:DUF6265 family protein [Usitatibacter sp.]
MRFGIAAAALLFWGFSHFARAQDAPTTPPLARVTDVAWIAGYWEGEGLGGRIEDIWMPPLNGVILGAFRLTKPDGKGFYELFAIEEAESSLQFVVKHFHPNWVGWEEKDKALRLRLTKIGPDEAVFGGVGFHREAPDSLVVRLTIRMKDGTTRDEVLRFRKRAL